jgi:hypothetical protein
MMYLPDGKYEEKKVVEAARLQPPFVLLNAFCTAKSYLNILRKQNISHLPLGKYFTRRRRISPDEVGFHCENA